MTQIEVNILGEAGSNLPDMLKLSNHEVVGTLRIFTGEQGEYWISIIPALNVTGYGESEADAFQALKENLDTFFADLFQLSDAERNNALGNMGWGMEKASPKKFSNPSVNEAKVLQNFDHPEQVKKSFERDSSDALENKPLKHGQNARLSLQLDRRELVLACSI